MLLFNRSGERFGFWLSLYDFMAEEDVDGCPQNARVHDPCAWDSHGDYSLAPTSRNGRLVLPGPSLWMVGLLPLLLGVGLYVWCAGTFTFIGRGTW